MISIGELCSKLDQNDDKIEQLRSEIEKLEEENKNIATQALREFLVETEFLKSGHIDSEKDKEFFYVVGLPKNDWLEHLIFSCDNYNFIFDKSVAIDLYYYKSDNRITIYSKLDASLEKVSKILEEIHLDVALKDFWRRKIEIKQQRITKVEQEIVELQKEIDRQ